MSERSSRRAEAYRRARRTVKKLYRLLSVPVLMALDRPALIVAAVIKPPGRAS